MLFENGKYRRFTPREVARIQSFPENYKLVGSEGAQYRMLGNAIPPVMMWHIANKLLYMLRNIEKVVVDFPGTKPITKFKQMDLFEDLEISATF
ncbi:Modification methylase AplI [compost metagenome]